MSVVLVVEPNSSQASALRKEIQKRVSAELILVDSTAKALEAIELRVPDLILLSALLSPKDEAALVEHLRSLDGASHLQTLTTPQLRVGKKAASRGKSGFGFGKKQKAVVVDAGCDPAVFAEEISAHLARAAEIRNRPPMPSPIRVAAREAEPVLEPVAETHPYVAQPYSYDEQPYMEPVIEPEAAFVAEPEPDAAPVFEPVFEPIAERPSYLERFSSEELVPVAAEAPAEPFFEAVAATPPDAARPYIDPAAAFEQLLAIAEKPPTPIEAQASRLTDGSQPGVASGEDDIERLVRTLGLNLSSVAIDEDEAEEEPKQPEVPEAEVEEADEDLSIDMLAEMRLAEAEAEAKLSAALDRVRAEADAERVAELARVQFEADGMRDQAIAEARAAAEREARETLAAELSRVRSEAESTFTEALNKVKVEAEQAERLRMDAQENFAADLARVRAEVEQTLGAQLDAARVEAERVRAAEAELVRMRAEAEAARVRVESEAARVRAETEARMASELDRLRADAERARLAEQSKAEQATEQIKEAAVLEARAIAEEAARRTLHAEIARVRREADALLAAELSRTRAEAEQRQSAELEELRAQMAELRDAAAEHARAAAAEAVASEVARATAQSQEKQAPRPTAVIARFPTAARVEPTVPRGIDIEEVQPLVEALAAEIAQEASAEGRRDYYSLWQSTPVPVVEQVQEIPETPEKPDEPNGRIFQSVVDEAPADSHLRRHAKWALPIAACLLLITNISTVARFATRAKEPVPTTIVQEKVPEPIVKIVDRNIGDLKVESTPAGADVRIDGKAYGRTPLTIPGLRAGAHTLVLRSSAGTVTKRVTIKAGETLVASEAIFSGWLAIFSPIPIVISLDGRAVQPTDDGKIMLAPGTYDVEMSSERFNYRRTEKLVVRPGAVTAFTLPLPKATVHLTAPAGAQIRVDNEIVGRTPMARLLVPIGSREIVVVHPEGGARRASVDVRFGEPTEVTLKFD
jgi:PEGA domain